MNCTLDNSVAASAVLLVSACLKKTNITIHPSVKLMITYKPLRPFCQI
jgi:hypothetical protein